MYVNTDANDKKLTLSFTLGRENVGTWLCVLSSRDTYLSAGANRNAFIAAVRKIEENWDAWPHEKLTTIGHVSIQFVRSKVKNNSVSFRFEVVRVKYRNFFASARKNITVNNLLLIKTVTIITLIKCNIIFYISYYI